MSPDDSVIVDVRGRNNVSEEYIRMLIPFGIMRIVLRASQPPPFNLVDCPLPTPCPLVHCAFVPSSCSCPRRWRPAPPPRVPIPNATTIPARSHGVHARGAASIPSTGRSLPAVICMCRSTTRPTRARQSALNLCACLPRRSPRRAQSRSTLEDPESPPVNPSRRRRTGCRTCRAGSLICWCLILGWFMTSISTQIK
jgi:hypothetical protein